MMPRRLAQIPYGSLFSPPIRFTISTSLLSLLLLGFVATAERDERIWNNIMYALTADVRVIGAR